MIIKSIPSAWLKLTGRRLDCGPYTSGSLETQLRISQLSVPTDKLQKVTQKGLAGIINAGRIKRLWVDDLKYGLPFLSSSDILQADLSNLRLISRKAAIENPALLIRKGWTLITRAGTIGRMVYAREDMDGMACSEDVLRVIPDHERIPPGYLYAYLSSTYGTSLVCGGTYGAIIQHLEPQHIADLPVPRLGPALEQQVHALVEEAGRCLTKYQVGVQDATKQLFESVGLVDISPSEWHREGPDLGFSAVFPRIDSFRALNFNPRFFKMVNRIRAGSWKRLDTICEEGSLRRGDRFKRIDASQEFAIQLVGQRDLFRLRSEGRWIARSATGNDVQVAPGTILVAARGTLGESELYCRSEFIWGPATSRGYSEDVLRIVADESLYPRGCLFAFMRSQIAFRMLRSISVGTKLQDHHHLLRSELPVPYPSIDVRNQISRIVVEAYNARHAAVALEDQARSLVERAIEEASGWPR